MVRRGFGRRGAQLFRARWAAAALAVLACGALSWLAPAPVAAQTTVWSATLTADYSDFNQPDIFTGCSSTSSHVNNCSTALSRDTFTLGGTAYTVAALQLETDDNGATWSLIFGFDKLIPKTVRTRGTLTLDGTAFPFSDRRFTETAGRHAFSQDSLSSGFTQNQRVRVTLSLPSREELGKHHWCFNRDDMSVGNCVAAIDQWDSQQDEINLPAGKHCPRTHAIRVATSGGVKCQKSYYYGGVSLGLPGARGPAGGGGNSGGGVGNNLVDGADPGGGQGQGGGGGQGQQGNGGGQAGPTLGRPVPDAAVSVAPGALRVDPTDDPATDNDERNATYQVSLTRAPTGPVMVTPVSSDTGIATATGALTFTTDDWKAAQAVTVTGIADGRVGIAHSITGGGYDAVQVPKVTVIVGNGGGDARKLSGRALSRASGRASCDGCGNNPDTHGGTDNNDNPDMDNNQGESPDTAADTGSIATDRDAPDESLDIVHAPPGALAALARGHLAGLHAALTPRLAASKAETSHITLAGHTLALDESLLAGLSGRALDWDALPVARGLSWHDSTGRCASWTTASCGAADTIDMTGLDSSLYGQPAGPWDGLLYNLATGLAGGGMGQSLWRDSGFVLTLGSEDNTGPGRRWTLWGKNRVQAVAGLPAGTHYDSELRSGWLGLDTGFGNNGRVGLALSRSGGPSPLRAVHPYLTWSDGITTVSALGGFGKSVDSDRHWHRHTADEPDSQANTSATTPATALTHAPLGLRMGLVEVQRALGVFGPLQLGLRADAAWASLSAGEGSTIQTETGRRLRVGLDATGSARQLPGGLSLTPSLQAHLRSDTGDGTTGRGLELSGGINAGYGPARLTVQGRLLTARSETATRERGLETTLSLGQPGSLGPSFSFSARWGDAAVGGDTLWQEQLHYRHRHDTARLRNNAWSLDARSEYGLVLPGGVRLTGFTRLSHDAFGPRVLFGLQRGHPAPAR